MKKPKEVADLAGFLQKAATTPALTVTQPETEILQTAKKKKSASLPLLLRVPVDLHSRLEAEAIARTKEIGRGVTMQQIIIEKLGACYE